MRTFLANTLLAIVLPLAQGAPGASALPSFVYHGDAPYGVSSSVMSSALTCPYGKPAKNANAVLLVHGTGSTGNETWGDGYVPALHSLGYTPCYVTLPNRSMDDLQVSAAYVAYNMHFLSYLAGGNPISIISHSQGCPNSQWALRFWPSTRKVTKTFIPLAPDFIGVVEFVAQCAVVGNVTGCQAALWQQALNSNYFKAEDYKGHKAFVNTSVIWSQVDGIVIPPKSNALLPGASVHSVQELCPARVVTHFQMIIDAAVFAMALDALEHGHLNLSRVSDSHCAMLTAKGMDVTIPATINDTYHDLVTGIILTGPRLHAEPPVKSYAQIKNQS